MAGTGGYIRRLLAPLAGAGVDAVQGISGPPQSDATLAEARAIAGPDLWLWGGIPQDALLADFPESDFEVVVRQAYELHGVVSTPEEMLSQGVGEYERTLLEIETRLAAEKKEAARG